MAVTAALRPNRRPSTSAQIGAALGGAFNEAGEMYLQGRMQEMFDQKKQQRDLEKQQESGKGFAKMLGDLNLVPKDKVDQLATQIGSLPIQVQSSMAKNMMGNLLSQSYASEFENLPSTPFGDSGQPIVPAASPQGFMGGQQPAGAPQAIPSQAAGQVPQAPPFLAAAAAQQRGQPVPVQIQPPIGQGKPFPSVPPTAQTALEKIEKKFAPEYEAAEETKNRLLRGAKNPSAQAAVMKDYENKIKRIDDKKSRAKETLKPVVEQQTKRTEAEQKELTDWMSESRAALESIPYQEALLKNAADSVMTGNFGLLSWDNIAEHTSIEQFRTAKGEALRSAAKEWLLWDVKGLGQKGNLMMDKLLASILPNVGKTKEANMSWIELQKLKLDLMIGKQAIIDELKPQFTDEFGNVFPSLRTEVNKRLRDYSTELQNRSSYHMQEILDSGKSLQELQDLKPNENTYLTPRRKQAFIDLAHGDVDKALKVAMKQGYKMPLKEWRQTNDLSK